MEAMKVAVIGKIIELSDVDNSDFLQSAVVVCGSSGKWRGVVNKKSNFSVGDLAEVYLPDALLPEVERFEFMRARKHKVTIARFRGQLSQVLIMPRESDAVFMEIGDSIQELYGVQKYEKPISGGSQQCGVFPSLYVPKTDELHFQMINQGEIPDKWVATLKMDGASMTVLYVRDEDDPWICSRNYRVRGNPYEAAASKIDLARLAKEYRNIALQCEVVGPGVQGNPSGAKVIAPYLFYAFDTERQLYLSRLETVRIADRLGIEAVKTVAMGDTKQTEEDFFCRIAESCVYNNGKPAEGIVVRPIYEMGRDKNTFKYINPLYGR